ncbi:hypothetical protein [Myxococcus xanthus]|uniref:hypothetical protein n=1 Tax=Myxococcus xanthus TaxID=34 RepID=UPI00112C395E|nr:hypothetical protein [Myxococcus xanthus]
MEPVSLRTAFCGLSLIAAPAAFAWGSTHSIPLFESQMAAGLRTREMARYYVTTWVDPYGRARPGDIGGYVVAFVNEDRDSVRFIEVMTWSQ